MSMSLRARRRALMAAQGGDAGPNYIVPSNSAGRGTTVATFTDGNLLHVSSFAKGVDNDIRGYFARAISIKSGDTVRVKTTRKSGSFSGTIQAYVYVGEFTINPDSSAAWSSSIDVSRTASANTTAEYVRIRNSSNTRTGTNDSHLVEIFINGEQVI